MKKCPCKNEPFDTESKPPTEFIPQNQEMTIGPQETTNTSSFMTYIPYCLSFSILLAIIFLIFYFVNKKN